MMELSGRQTVTQSRLDQMQKEIETRRQAVQYSVDNAISDAESAIAAKKCVGSRSLL